MKIPFCKTSLGEEEKKAISDVINSGWVVMGKKTEEFEQQFADYVGARYAVFVDSGTSALDLAVKYLLANNKWSKNKKINVPSLTFTSTAEVLVHNGLTPNFKDIQRESFLMEFENPLNSLPVHLMGNRVMTPSYIYDSAHRIIKGDLKTSDGMWCYSFYATKNMTTVQGGMIATNSAQENEWLRKARDHGLSHGTKERYEKSSFDYDVEFVGWREKSDDVHAAIGIEQLKKLPAMTVRRNEIVKLYNQAFDLNRMGNHLYPVLVNDRPKFVEYMKEKGVQVSVHFLPLHKMTGYKKYNTELPITEYLGSHLVSLPLFPGLSDEEANYVAGVVRASGMLIEE